MELSAHCFPVRVMIMCNVMLCTSNGKFVEFVDTNGASKNI